jgi:hypothetical protein
MPFISFSSLAAPLLCIEGILAVALVLIIQRKQPILKSFENFDDELYQPCNYHEHGTEIDNYECASNELGTMLSTLASYELIWRRYRR